MGSFGSSMRAKNEDQYQKKDLDMYVIISNLFKYIPLGGSKNAADGTI